MRRRILIGLLLLLLMFSGCTEGGETAEQIEEAGESSGLELAKDWRLLSVMATMISGIFVALAYLFGQGFELTDLKAWARVELVQIFATLVIIVTFSAALTFLDSIIAIGVNMSNLGFTCDFLESCAVQAADGYLGGLVEMTKGEIRDTTNNAVRASILASNRVGIGCDMAFMPVPCLQIYMSVGLPGLVDYTMWMEYYMQVMQFEASVLSILSSQQFFVNEISFKVAPILLLVGIVARSFFVTRKLGGLLMAIGLGVMFVFPAMYVVNWLTLNVTLFGDEILAETPQECPERCSIGAPSFYVPGQGLTDRDAVMDHIGVSGLSDGDVIELRLMERGQLEQADIAGTMIYSCEAEAMVSGVGYCSRLCRELPYPLTQECTERNMSKMAEEWCGDEGFLPEDFCEMEDAEPKKACYSMPNECRLIREVESPTPSACPEVCRTTLPLKWQCSNSCLEARDYCRVAQKKWVGGSISLIEIEERVDEEELPEECDAAQDCAQDLDAYDSCVYVHPDDEILDQCSACVLVSPEYTYDPPVYTDCSEKCDQSFKGPPKVSAAQFAEATRGDMFGKEGVKAVSSLILPAYILPLMNIVVTLMFIRTFSPIFGGDIEIPGVSKLL